MDQRGSMDVYEDFQTRSLSSIGKNRPDEREFQYRSTVQAIKTTQQKINLKISFDLLQNTQDYEKLLKDLKYQQIRFIAKGSQSYAFKAINMKKQIVAVKVCKNTEESLKAITMQQQINNDKARNMNESTILQYNVMIIDDILITEEDLAQLTLEDLLQQRALLQQKFSLQEIKAICFDLVDQLYILHTKGRINLCKFIESAHNDIKPENIMIQNGKFILHDYGAATYVPKSESEILNQVVGTILYMSPLKLQHFQEYGQSVDLSGTFQYEAKSDICHNPFKSDIYSLGMVLLRLLLHNEDFTTLVQIENIFYHNRSSLLPLMIQKYPFYYKLERFVYNKQQNKLKQVINLLELMLKEEEDERINTIDLALMVDVNIFAGVETPYTNIFIPKIQEIYNGYRVIYSLNHLIYEGQLNPQTHERQGYGQIFKPKMSEQLSSKQYADLYQKYRKDKKNNTILEEEEIDYDVSDITQAPTESQFSQRHSVLGNNNKQFQILYEGVWSKDIPNDHGKLNCYNAINIKGSHKQNELDFEELNFTIESEIIYGYLNGHATIKQQPKNYIVNINTEFMKNIDQQNYEKQYILFQEEELSGNIFGYVSDNDQLTIDLSQVQDRDGLIEIVAQFCQTVQPQDISYNKDQDYQSLILQSDDKKLLLILKKPFLVRKRREIQLQTKEGSSLLCCVQQQKKSTRSSQTSEISETCDLISEVLMKIFEKTQLNNLKSINLFDCMFNDQTFMVLIQQDKPMKVFILNQKIEELDLSGCLISDTMMALIISSPIVYYLKVLKISHTICGQETVTAMITSDKFNQLQKLSISQCSGMKPIEQYIQSDKAQRLALLDISHNRWVNDDFMKLINLVYLPNLRSINLYNCTQLNARAINNFKQSPIGQKVQIMVNTQNLIQIQIIRKQFNLENSIGQKLAQIQKESQHSKIFDDTLKILSHSQGLSSVESLNLRDQQITHYGLGNLISSQYIYMIHTIDCSNTFIKGDIFKIISQSKLNSLRHLIFQNCNHIVAQDVRDFARDVKAAMIQTFQISSALIPSKQIIRNLKQFQKLEDIWITFQKWDQDVPSELKSLFSWCFNLLLSRQIKSLYLDVSLFPDCSEGFNQFMDLAGQLDISVRIKVDPNSILARDLKMLRNINVIE